MSFESTDDLRSVYVVTLWSGGMPSKTWKTLEEPELLANGAGVRFTNLQTNLRVQVIGDLTIEEYEQGSKLLEKAWKAREFEIPPEARATETPPPRGRDDNADNLPFFE